MKKILFFIIICISANQISAYDTSNFAEQLSNVKISKNVDIANDKCPNSSDGCLVRSANGELTIYIKEFTSVEMEDIAIFGLMYDAFQFQVNGNVDKFKTCRMKLTYAQQNNHRSAASLLKKKC
tara:strand:- start:2190 stop:2561 length:372 start_codon:yes stop_codon:yes gene_type:complete